MTSSFATREEFDKHLYERFPNLYRDMYGDKRSTAMVWGICCERGWWPTIETMSEKLEALIIQLPEEERQLCKAVQIKQKFGGLRCSLDNSTEEMRAVIREAEALCDKTCEDCGQPGELRQYGWWKVMCQTCLDTDKKRPVILPESKSE
jgi:hypothetical protein